MPTQDRRNSIDDIDHIFSTTTPAILAIVPSLKTTCFLAIPFAPEFDNLSRVISDAALSLKLTPLRTDITQNDVDFTRDIYHEIRAARLIVAVLLPEEGSKTPNANVMYEIGLAHALGKPTLLIASKSNPLPADLAAKYISPILYSDQRDLARIRAEMGKLLNDIKDSILVHPAYNEEGIISFISTHAAMCLRPLFWEKVKVLEVFAQTIYHALLPVAVAIALLVKEAEFISNCCANDIAIPALTKRRLQETLNDYGMYYQDALKELFGNSTPQKADIYQAFTYLNEEAKDPRAKETLSKLQAQFDSIIKGLESYQKLQDAIFSTTDLYERINCLEFAPQIIANLRQLSILLTTTLGAQANAALRRLINMTG